MDAPGLPTVNPPSPPSLRLDGLIFCGLVVLIGATCLRSYKPYTFIFRDGSFYAQTNRSIARGLTLRQEEFQPRSWYDGSLPWYRDLDLAWSNVSVGTGGEWYPKHSYLMPIFSTPFFVVFGPNGLLIFNAMAMVMALFFGYRLAARFTEPGPAAVALFLVAQSPLVPYLAYAYSHDVFYAALIAGGAHLLASGRPGWAGTLFGLSLVAKVTNVLIVVPLFLALAPRKRRALARAILFGAVPLTAYVLANWVMYGSPLVTSYQRVLTVHDGHPVVTSHEDAFSTPILEGLRRFFSVSPEGEIGQMALIALLAYGGLLFLVRRAPEMTAALVVSLALFFVVFAKYRYGGARFFMPWLVLSVVPGAAMLSAVVQGFMAIRDRVWSGWTSNRRRLAAWVTAVLVALAVGFFWWLGRPRPTASMAQDVERLNVHLDDIPCDYFNMTHQKWECSHLDPGGRHLVGLAIGDECPGMERPVLYVPSHPRGRTRVVRWSPQVAGSHLRIRWMWDGKPPGKDLEWTLRVGEGQEIVMRQAGFRSVSFEEVKKPVEAGGDVVLTLPARGGDVILCVSVEVGE